LFFSGARFLDSLGEIPRFFESIASDPKNLGVGCERAESLLIDNYARWNGPMRPDSNQECIEPRWNWLNTVPKGRQAMGLYSL